MTHHKTTPECQRCGAPFEPKYLDALKKMSTMCETCMVRNLFDGLGLHSPPELLDKHTLKPTLTREEFTKKLRGTNISFKP